LRGTSPFPPISLLPVDEFTTASDAADPDDANNGVADVDEQIVIHGF
jgi:hypothetical protein